MNSNQLIYEMSNQPLDIPEQKIGMEFGAIQTVTSFHQQFHSCPVVEELHMTPTIAAESSFVSPMDTLEVPLSQPDVITAVTEEIVQNQQNHPKKKVLPVKPCVVLLKRNRAVEAAWQREQARRQKERFSKNYSKQDRVWSHISRRRGKSSSHRSLPGPSGSGFTCQLCAGEFPSRTSFMQHLRSEHTLTCELCGKVLSSPHKLKDHLRFVHGTNCEDLVKRPHRFPCIYCHKKARSRASLEKHVILRHSSPNLGIESSQSESSLIYYTCNDCGVELDSKLKLKQHLFEYHINDVDNEDENLHENNNSSQSLPATTITETLKEIVKEEEEEEEEPAKMMQPTGPPVTAYECPHCHTLHANKDRFKKHLGFVWPASFTNHQVSVDPQVLVQQKEPIKCKVCGARAANLAFLHTHQSSHSELDRPHVCPDPCNRQFLFRCQLDRHALIHQLGAPMKSSFDPNNPVVSSQRGRHKCVICSKRARSVARLQAHIACCHKGDDIEFRCKVCDVCFPSAKSLGRHCNKKQHILSEEQSTAGSDAWIAPETPNVTTATATVHVAQAVRPDSLGSSDSVSTSDAFSMYFQSLHSLSSLDMALDLGGNAAALFENVNCPDVIPNPNKDLCFPSETGTSQLLQGRPAVTAVTELNSLESSDLDRELQFHTLQTVPLEPLSELEATYLSNVKVEPLSQINPITNLEPMQVDSLIETEPLFMKSEPVNSQINLNATFLQNMPPIETPVSVKFQEDTTYQHNMQIGPSLAQLETFLVMSGDLQSQYPIDIEDLCNESVNLLPEVSTDCSLPSKVLMQQQPVVDNPEEKLSPATVTASTSQDLNYPLNINSVIKEELDSTTQSLQNMCDSTTLDFTSSTTKIEDVENVCDVSNLSFLPELNDADCNIQILADACDSSSLSDLGGSIGEPSSKGKGNRKPGGSCVDCGKVFSSAHSAARHAKLSCPGRDAASLQVCCPRCGLRLRDRKELHRHKREAHPDTLFTCLACTKTFFLAQSLARHQKESCSHRDTFPCRQCKVHLTSIELLRSHTAEAHPGTLATCEICGKTLSSAQSLRRHLRSHKPGEESLVVTEQVETEKETIEIKEVVKKSKGKKKIKVSVDVGEQTISLPPIETIQTHKLQEDPMLNQNLIMKTEININKEHSHGIENINEDILSDFASISTNQLFNGNINGDSDSLPEEFNISDMFLIKNGALQCDFCDASFPNDKLLLRHLSSQHFPNTQWQPAHPSQNGTGSVASLNVATTSGNSAMLQCDLPYILS